MRRFAPPMRPPNTAFPCWCSSVRRKMNSGGNSRFTAGAFRCVYDGVEDLRALMPDLSDEEVANTDFGTYTQEKFFDDMGRVTEYRTDPDLCELLVTRSKETMRWLQKKGIRFIPIYGRQAYKIDGKFKFWGGLTVESGAADRASSRRTPRSPGKTASRSPTTHARFHLSQTMTVSTAYA